MWTQICRELQEAGFEESKQFYLKSFLNKHNKSSIKSWAEEGTDPQWLVGKMSKYKEQFPNMQVKKIWEKVLLNNPSMDLKRQKNFKTEQSYKQMQVLYIYIYIYTHTHSNKPGTGDIIELIMNRKSGGCCGKPCARCFPLLDRPWCDS